MHQLLKFIQDLLGAGAEARRESLRDKAHDLLAADRAARREGGAA